MFFFFKFKFKFKILVYHCHKDGWTKIHEGLDVNKLHYSFNDAKGKLFILFYFKLLLKLLKKMNIQVIMKINIIIK